MDIININRFNSRQDNKVQPLPSTWGNIVQLFINGHNVITDKNDAPLFNAALYKTLDEIPDGSENRGVDSRTQDLFVKRRKVNIKEVSLLILDYDKDMSIGEAKERFKELTYFGYTSYNHKVNPEIEKFRLVFLLSKPIPAWVRLNEVGSEVDWGDWYHIENALKEFAGPCDPASFSANQMYFVPSVHEDNQENAESWYNDGQPLDWTQFDKVPYDKYHPSMVPSGDVAHTHSKFLLDPDDTLMTSRGPIQVKDIQGVVNGVTCPFHTDMKGTEFVRKVEATGNIFLQCKKCGTIYMKREGDVIQQVVSQHQEPKTSPKVPEQPQKFESQDDLIDEVLGKQFRSDYLAEYHSAEDRGLVLQQLKKIKQVIDEDRGYKPDLSKDFSVFKSHILYLPEGAGKSRLAIDFAMDGQKIVFACKSWDQAREKHRDFLEIGLQLGFTTQLFESKDAKVRRRFRVSPVRSKQKSPYGMGKILDEETIQAIIKHNPDLNPDYIRLSWEFFSTDTLSHQSLPEKTTLEAQTTEPDIGDGYSGIDTNILVTTFAQLRILSQKNQYIPHDWIVWIDDPDDSDVIDIEPYDIGRWDELPSDKLEEKTCVINEKRYFRRNLKESLGYAYRYHKCIYTTTEMVTKEGICKLFKSREEEYIVHDKMNNLYGGTITVLGTNKVWKKHDGIIPLVSRRLQKMGHRNILIANGMGSEYNHSNNKGKNNLDQTNILVELSSPHPDQVRTICDALGKQFGRDSREVGKNMMLDCMHQAIGRNSGYRHKGFECVVLVDKSAHKSMKEAVRYFIDQENSVVIDRTQSMSRRETRTTEQATKMVQDLESLLGHLDLYLKDYRKVKPDVDYVLKHTESESNRFKFSGVVN